MKIIEDFMTQAAEAASFHEGNALHGVITRPDKKQFKYEFIFDVAGAGTGSEWECSTNSLAVDPAGCLTGELELNPHHFKRAIQVMIENRMFPGTTVALLNETYKKFGVKVSADNFDITWVLNEGQLGEMQVNDIASKQICFNLPNFPMEHKVAHNTLKIEATDLPPLDYDVRIYDFNALNDYVEEKDDDYYEHLEGELEDISEELEEDDHGLASIDAKVNFALRIKRIK